MSIDMMQIIVKYLHIGTGGGSFFTNATVITIGNVAVTAMTV